MGNLDLIRVRSTEDRIVRLAENAFKAAERGSRLTSQLLAFSRTQKLATKPVNVNRLIEGWVELLVQSIGPSVTVRTDLDPNLRVAIADATQLELAILNLGINARDAMPEGGTITLSTTSLRLDEGDDRLASGDYIVVSVRDSGTGMSAETLARAFDPFFTTKPPGKGTVLGLSQVYGIAKQSGGVARISSVVGEGTAVSILLPDSTDDAASEVLLEESEIAGRNFETVLVVEDDPDVRGLVTEFLSDLSYQVLFAENAEKGLEMLNQLEPDLLIVDYAMPGMNGADLARAVKQRMPSLPILFLSGYADSSALEAAVGHAPLLRKPFRPSELAAVVRSILTPANSNGTVSPPKAWDGMGRPFKGK